MPYEKDLVNEINMLVLFDVSNNQEGLKVHSSANEDTVEATNRLHVKGLITKKDGGYLTDLGIEAAEHAQSLQRILTTN